MAITICIFLQNTARMRMGQNHRFYRLHAMNPHTIEMALAYDIKCPCCSNNTLKQVGRCLDSHELGLRVPGLRQKVKEDHDHDYF